MKEARAQRFPACRVLDDALLDIIQPNALHPRGGAIQITGLLTVKLNEGRAIIEGFLLRLHFAEKIRAAQVNAAIAADMQLVAGIDADHANVLDRCFGAVARTAANRRSEEHTSELQSLMRISYAVFCLKKKKKRQII